MTLLRDVTPVGIALRERVAQRARMLTALIDRIETEIQTAVVERGADHIAISLEVHESGFKTEVADAYDVAGWVVKIEADCLYLSVPPPL